MVKSVFARTINDTTKNLRRCRYPCRRFSHTDTAAFPIDRVPLRCRHAKERPLNNTLTDCYSYAI